MKYTDEELSMILSEHAGPGMRRNGSWSMEPGHLCIEQVAHNDEAMVYICGHETHAGYGWMSGYAWFDRRYNGNWTPEEFLAALKHAGLA